jgi:hypothetical protein
MTAPFLRIRLLPTGAYSGRCGLSRRRAPPQDHQGGLCEEAEGDEAMPRVPGAHLVVIQPHFSFGLRKALFNRPAHLSDPHQFWYRGRRRAVGQIEAEVARVLWVTTEKQPAALPRGTWGGQRQANPLLGLGA